MNGKDKPLGMNHVSAKYIEEAETVTCLKKRDPAAAVYFLGLLLIAVYFCLTSL